MQNYKVQKDIAAFGKQVATFPMGIKETFDMLSEMVPDGLKRNYFGLSRMADDGSILYYAAVEEAYPGEAKVYELDNYIIEEGDYLSKTVLNWYDNLDSIKDVFQEMTQAQDADLSKLCVEWYKSDYEMVCMLKKK